MLDKKGVAFDIDETLAESFKAPTPAMLERLSRLLEVVPIAIMTGAGFERIYDNYLNVLESSAKVSQLFVFPNSAAQGYTWADGWNQEYDLELSEADRARIKAAIGSVSEALPEIRDTQTFGERIADRGAQVAFTVVGLEAPQEIKMAWDPGAAKRRIIREHLLKLLPEFDIRTGGASTIDITRSGINKAYGVRWLAERLKCEPRDMVYVGDALYEGGNDYVVIETGIQTHRVNGPNDTEKVIDDLLRSV